MIRTRPIHALCVLATALPPATAQAAERSYSVSNFDRVRVEGAFDVRLSTGKSPGARVQGAARAIDGLEVRVDGMTLVIRAGANGWGEQPAASDQGPPVITLSTPAIRSAAVIGGGRLAVGGPVKGQRIDLSLSGSGTFEAAAVDADQLNATVIGSGTMKLGGRAAKVRLNASGSGSMEAAALKAGDLIALLDGPGQLRATAGFTANVTTTGLGAATVYGKPACTVKAMANGPISCGKQPAPALP